MKGTPWWLWVAVIAVGVALGLGLRPLLQGGAGGGGAAANLTPSVRCPGPSGSEQALEEFITPGVDGTSAVFERTYRLERPGQAPLSFAAGASDADSAPVNCANVRFGPGPRVAFARGQQVSVVELVGPSVRNWSASTDRDLTNVVLEQRWQLGLKVADYVAQAPQISEDGTGGRVVLERTDTSTAFPRRFIFTTTNGGASWTLDKASSLAGF